MPTYTLDTYSDNSGTGFSTYVSSHTTGTYTINYGYSVPAFTSTTMVNLNSNSWNFYEQHYEGFMNDEGIIDFRLKLIKDQGEIL